MVAIHNEWTWHESSGRPALRYRPPYYGVAGKK